MKKNLLKAFRLPPALAIRLKRASEKKEWPMSMVVREALDRYLKSMGV